MQYRKTTDAANVFNCYLFEKNLQGDIVGIYNTSGTKLATYTYDAWGVMTVSVTSGITTTDRLAAILNPFRYRGYYFDSETGFYYLNSRYYNPNWGRFISADTSSVLPLTKGGLTDKNLFAYCDNNPITRKDDGGKFWNLIAGAVIGAAINIATSYIAAKMAGEKYTWKEALVDGVSGAITGLVASTGLGAINSTRSRWCSDWWVI